MRRFFWWCWCCRWHSKRALFHDLSWTGHPIQVISGVMECTACGTRWGRE